MNADQMKEWNEAKRKYDESDNDSAYSTTMESQHSEVYGRLL